MWNQAPSGCVSLEWSATSFEGGKTMLESQTSGPSRGSAYRLAVACVTGIGAVLLVPADGAHATEPTRQTIVQSLVSGAPCPSGITLRGSFQVTRDITTFYDASGVPVAQQQHNSAEGTWANPLTGDSLEAVVVRVIHTDLTTGESFSTGSNSRTFLPGGGGVAIGAAGLQVFDASGHLVEHFGPDSDAERAQLCAALGA
jgi:hypothetical protein